jgi:hypothetical protein
VASFQSHSQTGGIHGVISDEQAKPLSFATIFVKQSGTGTTANEDGFYEILLPAGQYELVFQHLGRKSEVRVIKVDTDFTELDITLVPQEIMLQPVTVNADDEDPAYSIMRKAIAKANYHRLAGIRENVFVNYLATPSSKNYTEIGYSIDGILRIFRLEAAAFRDGKYVGYGFRFGIATNIAVNFSD